MNVPMGARILVIDDEPAILRTVRTNLGRHGYRVDVAQTGQAALGVYSRVHPDLLLLDLGLPDTEGFDVIRSVRARGTTPIIVLSVRGAERDKVTALDLGADDYLTKPFGVDELLARIRAALRHAGADRGTDGLVRSGDLAVDLEHRLVSVRGRNVHLTPTEYELLKVFLAHPNKVLTDRILLQQVWGLEYGPEVGYLYVYMTRLRKKLELDPRTPRVLVNEPGVGYRFVADSL